VRSSQFNNATSVVASRINDPLRFTPAINTAQVRCLYYGKARTPLARIVPDARYAGMWRIAWPAGGVSDMVNLARAKDASMAIAERGPPARDRLMLHWKGIEERRTASPVSATDRPAIHHTGKDEKRGPRGSNAMLGDVDLQVQISGQERVKTAKATKANDQAEGELFRFSMKSADLGTDEDGDPITVGVVDDAEPCGAAQSADWPNCCQDLRDALNEALIDAGFDHTIPKGPTVKAAHLDAVRAVFRSHFIDAVEDDPDRPHRRADDAFHRRMTAVRKARLLAGGTVAGRAVIWLAR
jgi:hypothetical protein